VSEYRDPLAGLRSQVATKRGVVASRGAALSAVVRAVLPADVLDRLRAYEARIEAAPETMEALAEIDSALEGLLAVYDEIAFIAPALLAYPLDVPDPPRPAQAPPWLIEERPRLEIRALADARLDELTPGTALVRWGDLGYVARFSFGEVSFVYRLEVHASDDHTIGPFSCALRTSVPSALAPLRVRRERVHHAVGKLLHVARELELGASAFDDAFWITGDARTSALLEDAGVQRSLLAMKAHAPDLSIASGIAELAWVAGLFDPVPETVLPTPAIGALVHLRAVIDRGRV